MLYNRYKNINITKKNVIFTYELVQNLLHVPSMASFVYSFVNKFFKISPLISTSQVSEVRSTISNSNNVNPAYTPEPFIHAQVK